MHASKGVVVAVVQGFILLLRGCLLWTEGLFVVVDVFGGDARFMSTRHGERWWAGGRRVDGFVTTINNHVVHSLVGGLNAVDGWEKSL
mmetsp:Transcript_5526/g.8506  ORF Transcript_5526/g.8506 Transcript_5526/m.8506 type:complete len:88 (+) Transcript_5526:227-490(+)